MASGKGGTGKTTLTALFAHLASAGLRVTVADADVEASNLPLALRVGAVACETFEGGGKAVIAEDACAGWALCVDVCRFEAISALPSGSYGVDPFACEGCRRCVTVCPNGAISIHAGRAGEVCDGDSAIGPVAFGQLGPGEDLSGKLVTEVRRHADTAAERHAAQVLLIDGPPGIGCPLIAAVANADLVVAVAEPTISGAHDLERLARLTARLRLPLRVVLNKADLSKEGASRVRTLCAAEGIRIIAEIPFDPALAGLLESLAEGIGAETPAEAGPGLRQAALAWTAVEAEIAPTLSA